MAELTEHYFQTYIEYTDPTDPEGVRRRGGTVHYGNVNNLAQIYREQGYTQIEAVDVEFKRYGKKGKLRTKVLERIPLT